MLASLLIQTLNGLASASLLFLVALGLSLIFGVTRIVNFAHGSFYMLGAYVAATLFEWLGRGALGFWGGALGAAFAIAALGFLIERTVLRRIYQAPELLQLVATFGIVLILKDVALYLWGPEDILGPRPPGLTGSILVLGKPFPAYDGFLLLLGPVLLAAVWALLNRTGWGLAVRAATEDRDMAAALGIDQAWLFSTVFMLGAFLAGLSGALALPREPASLGLDLAVIADVFVVTVVGGLGSIPGAYAAAVLISVVKAWCIGLGNVTVAGVTVSFTKLTLVAEFVVMAAVLLLRPWGLLGVQPAAARVAGAAHRPLPPPDRRQWTMAAGVLGGLLLLPLAADRYTLVLMTDVAVFALVAASLAILMGWGGMASFGHAAYFGAGAYGAALAGLAGWPFFTSLLAGVALAGLLAALVGRLALRASGISLAMLTLAFAQIAWAIAFQWDGVTGGSNGLVGVWPPAPLAGKTAYYLFAVAIAGLAIAGIWRLAHSPFGYALRAVRDRAQRAEASGLDPGRLRAAAFVLSGALAGLAGTVYVFSKGSLAPDVLAIPRSVDALVMVLLGGVETLTGPAVGAFVFTLLQDHVTRATPYWQAVLGAAIVTLTLLFPGGIVGTLRAGRGASRQQPPPGPTAATAARPGPDPPAAALPAAPVRAPPATAHPALQVRDLARAFDGVRAVDGVSFAIAAGEIAALIGPNGAGKTTTFNLVNGQLAPDRGRVLLDGRDVTGAGPRTLWQLGVARTFQITATYPSLTVAENIAVALLPMAGAARLWQLGQLPTLGSPEARALIRDIGLEPLADRVCSTLAYGDLKRVELAMALANRPRLLLMDEPTAGMAAGERDALMLAAVAAARQRGAAILFTEHDMSVVFRHAERVLVMSRGRLIAEGAPDVIRADARVREVYLGRGLGRVGSADTGA